MLSEHGCPIAPSTFYQAVSRRPSRRHLRDEQLIALIAAERADSRYVAGLGARKMWLRLRSPGHDVARSAIERLMAQMGVTGLTRGGRPPRTTRPTRPRPGPLTWSTGVSPRPGQPAVGRRLHLLPNLGGHGLRRVRVRRVLPPDPGLARRDCDDDPAGPGLPGAGHLDPPPGRHPDLSGLVHHTDAGSQYTSVAFTSRLAKAGIDPSVGSVGDAYDNALAESQIGLFKTELFHPHGPWRDRDHLEPAILDWVTWFNTERPHESVDDFTPVDAEHLHYRYRASLDQAG